MRTLGFKARVLLREGRTAEALPPLDQATVGSVGEAPKEYAEGLKKTIGEWEAEARKQPDFRRSGVGVAIDDKTSTLDDMMSSTIEMLAPLLSGARVRVLATLLTDPNRESYLREIARAAGVPLRAVQRELALYQSIGLISRRPRGREVFIAVDRAHPLFAGLRALLAQAAAVPGIAAPDPGVPRTAGAIPPDAPQPVSHTVPESTPEPTPHAVPESVPGPEVAIVNGKASVIRSGRRQPAQDVPAADETWRVW